MLPPNQTPNCFFFLDFYLLIKGIKFHAFFTLILVLLFNLWFFSLQIQLNIALNIYLFKRNISKRPTLPLFFFISLASDKTNKNTQLLTLELIFPPSSIYIHIPHPALALKLHDTCLDLLIIIYNKIQNKYIYLTAIYKKIHFI